MAKKAVDPVIRLMNNIELSPDGCWNWVGSTTTNEYGDVLAAMHVSRVDGKPGYMPRHAHRVSFEFFVGKIPKGMIVNRNCNNKLCVNPSHLELITDVDKIYRRKPGRVPVDVAVRLMDHVELSRDGCWNWTGELDKDGYGQIHVGPRRWQIRKRPHRVSYELFVGEIDPDIQLHHKCENRRCVNPSHLEPLTAPEHIKKSPNTLTFINALKTHCPLGHPLFGANLYIRNGRRHCRECRRINGARYFHNKQTKTKLIISKSLNT